jgi:hypothetical protein
MIDVALALALAVFVWRRPQTVVCVLWLAAVVLASRCVFEPVMTPYYLAPPLFLGMIMASRLGTKRFIAAFALALEVTVFAYHHLNPWVWWLPVVASLAGILALGYPGNLRLRSSRSAATDGVSVASGIPTLPPLVHIPATNREPALI